MPSIRPLSVADPVAVETLLDRAFGIDRRGRTAYRLRTGMAAIPTLSFAAFEDEQLVGTLQSWPIQLVCDDGAIEPLVLVGPVAVQPDHQRGGVGIALMKAMLDASAREREDALVLIGDPEYYERLFGFSAVETGLWQVPGPVERHRLLARLAGDRLAGRGGMLGPRAA